MPRHYPTQCWLLAIRPHKNKLCWKLIKIQNIPYFGSMKKCISEIQNWMNVIFLKNGLQINDKAVFFASCQSPHTWYDNEHGQRTHTPQNVRQLGVISFQTANRERHVNKVHKTAYMHMSNKIMHCITRCMRVLNTRFHHHTTGLALQLGHLKLLIENLLIVQNFLARVITGTLNYGIICGCVHQPSSFLQWFYHVYSEMRLGTY